MLRTHIKKENAFCTSFLLARAHTLTHLLTHFLFNPFIYSLAQFPSTNYSTKQMMKIGSISFFPMLRFVSLHRYKGENKWKNVVCFFTSTSFIRRRRRSTNRWIHREFFFSFKLYSTSIYSIFLLPISLHFILFYFSLRSVQWAIHTLFGFAFGSTKYRFSLE